MRLLARFLEIRVAPDAWPALTRAAGFGEMKSHADQTAPGAHLGDWASNSAFFARARLGEWQKVLNDDNQALYRQLAPHRAAPDLLAWLEGGRAAVDPLSE